MPWLTIVTLLVNYAALFGSVWLGLYIITRSPRYTPSWLTALTIWSISGLYLNSLLSLLPPPQPSIQPAWLRFLFPFWSVARTSDPLSWLQGWSIAPAIAFWHHATMLMRPGRMNPWRTLRVTLVYVVALAAIGVQTESQILRVIPGGNPLYLNTLHAGPLYGLFGIALIAFTAMSLINLLRSAGNAESIIQRKQLLTLAAVTVVAGLTGPVSILASVLLLPVPILALNLLLAVTVALIGFGVARYSALMEARTIEKDLFNNLVLATAVALIYLLATILLQRVYDLPATITVLIPTLAIITHMLAGSARQLYDLLFLRTERKDLRYELHRLARMAGAGDPLQGTLSDAIHALCGGVRASYGLLLVCEPQGARLLATFHWHGGRPDLSREDLRADEYLHLPPGRFAPPLHEASLLIPIFDRDEQVGALLLGQPSNGLRYAEAEINGLMNSIDWIGAIIGRALRQTELLRDVADLIGSRPEDPLPPTSQDMIAAVEDGLRNLTDYAYLADTSLARLRLVRKRLSDGPVTHLDRGKQTHLVLLEGLEKLRPPGEMPAKAPAREWYPYLILRDAYRESIPNQEIMARLYISEGTFNRTRRAAIRSLTRALLEMEASS